MFPSSYDLTSFKRRVSRHLSLNFLITHKQVSFFSTFCCAWPVTSPAYKIFTVLDLFMT
ncbi:hypothetical protein E2C01_064419 [Portunus trituberculatus]|uniref:Uncharacterized protein n=1 Tax=Portunus trituberculatus TaxID=210409 RepID=A0A5B7HN59_PORTR|nr:hypothetical protein [Portunus trituberculatus]